jgi:hypothetical protein
VGSRYHKFFKQHFEITYPLTFLNYSAKSLQGRHIIQVDEIADRQAESGNLKGQVYPGLSSLKSGHPTGTAD